MESASGDALLQRTSKAHHTCPPGILGHIDANNCVCGGSHTDPGSGWDWTYYINKVNGTTTPPNPTTGWWGDKDMTPSSADTTLRYFAEDAAGNIESPAKQEIYAILADDGSIAEAKQAHDEGDLPEVDSEPFKRKRPASQSGAGRFFRLPADGPH